MATKKTTKKRATQRHTAPQDEKLQAAAALIERRQRQLEDARQQARDLAIAHLLEQDKAAQDIQKQEQEVNAELHRLRITLDRKKYSVQVTEQKLAQKRKEVDETIDKVHNLEQKQQKLKDSLEERKEALAKKANNDILAV